MIKKFMKDKRGVIWVWVVILIGLFIFSLVWFTTGYALLEISDTVTDQYTFPAPASYAAEFILSVFRYGPILFLFGMALWAYVNSQRRRPIGYD